MTDFYEDDEPVAKVRAAYTAGQHDLTRPPAGYNATLTIPTTTTAWSWPPTQLTAVVDGDTVDCHLTRDIGFGGSVTFPVRLRLNRINAPKGSTTAGKTATARVNALTRGVVVQITTVKHYKYGGPDNTTGEYMAEIVLPDGANLSDQLVAEGLAVYWNGEGPRPDDGIREDSA